MDPGCTQSTQAGVVVIDLTEESDDDDDDVEIVPMQELTLLTSYNSVSYNKENRVGG